MATSGNKDFSDSNVNSAIERTKVMIRNCQNVVATLQEMLFSLELQRDQDIEQFEALFVVGRGPDVLTLLSLGCSIDLPNGYTVKSISGKIHVGGRGYEEIAVEELSEAGLRNILKTISEFEIWIDENERSNGI